MDQSIKILNNFNSIRKTNNYFFVLLFFLLSPFLLFFVSLFRLRHQWAQFSVILFIGFLGYTFHLTEGSDSNRYRDSFLYNASIESSDSNFYERISLYGTGSVDFIESFISFLLSRFTSNYRILFLAYGLIFGFFYVKSLGLLLAYNENKKTYSINIIYLICFGFIWAIWDFNVFRFTTASMMFIYGSLPFVYKKSYENILWILITPFMHFSFFLPVFLLLIYRPIRSNLNFCFIFLLVGLFFSEIDFEFVRNLSANLPEAFQNKTEMYANENFAQYRLELNESKNWYAEIYQKVLKWISVIIMLSSYWNIQYKRYFNQSYRDFLSFCLFFYGFFSLFSNIPTFSRFLFLGSLFIMGFAFLYFQFLNQNKKIHSRVISWLLILPISFFIIVKLRIGTEFISFNTIIANPITASINSESAPILSILKK